MSRHLMILPSLACQANCAYCFGPNRGPTMAPQVFDAAVDWVASISRADECLDLTFHGGEPLIAGREWYARSLQILRRRFGDQLKLHLQSNLWLLDDEYCALFNEYGVSLGTSLDGPEHINDPQRGEGYFAKTMTGIETARRNRLDVGVICTFTRPSASHFREVLDFFIKQRLSFSVHAAVSTLNDHHGNGLVMSPQEHADLLVHLFDAYMENIDRVQVSTFDLMAQGLSTGNGGICTLGDCLGEYLTIGPYGGIYSCNRFAYLPEWQLSSLREQPSQDTLSRSSVWKRLRERESTVHEDCGDCPHFTYCKGGCPYNAVTDGTGQRDPHCTAYRRLLDHIADRALEEVFSQKNMDAVVAHGLGENGLMRRGKLLQVMRGGPHPRQVAPRARELVAAVALAVSDSPKEALRKLDRAGLITRPDLAMGSLTALQDRLDTQSQNGLVNAYVHVTYACNLACNHCYARSGPERKSPIMTMDEVLCLMREAAEAGFHKFVVTGGEPMTHPQRDALLDALVLLRDEVKPLQTVIRTNLAYRLTPALVKRLAHSVDQVVVSVDGDQASHDARRGVGTYARTVENLTKLLAVNPSTKVGITGILTTEQIAGQEGDAVRALGKELGVRVRFKSVLPLGRGSNFSLRPAFYMSLEDYAEAIAYGAQTAATCGLGMNLYIGPCGTCYPCYALMDARHHLGNVLEDGLAAVLARNDTYQQFTVDSNRQCSHCSLRYVCGGFCRAWGTLDDPNAPPNDCNALYQRAQELLFGALGVLNVSIEQWLAAGLPCPEPSSGSEFDIFPTVKRDCVDYRSQSWRKASCRFSDHPTLKN